MVDLSFSLNLTQASVSKAANAAGRTYTAGDGLHLFPGNDFYDSFQSSNFNTYADSQKLNALRPNGPPTDFTAAELDNIHLNPGDRIVIDSSFNPLDYRFNDFSFFLVKQANLIANAGLIADSYANGVNFITTITANAAGDFKLLLGVADAGDIKEPSELVIHSVSVQTSSYSIGTTGVSLADGTLLRADGAIILPGGTQSALSLTTGAASLVSTLDGLLASKLITQDGGGLVAQGGGNVVSNDGGSLISQDGGGVVSNGGLITQDGGGFTSASLAQDLRLDTSGLLGRTFSAVPLPPVKLQASPIAGAEVTVTPAASTVASQDTPQIAALDNGKFATVWTSTDSKGIQTVRAQITNADGTPFGGVIRVDVGLASILGQFTPSIAAIPGGRFGIAWTSLSKENGSAIADDVRVAFIDSDGSQLSSSIFSIPGNQSQPVLASLGTVGAVLVYRDDNGSPSTSQLKAVRFDATGNKSGGTLVESTSIDFASNPAVVGLGTNQFAIAYSSFRTGGTGDADGIWLVLPGNGAAIQVNTSATGIQDLPSIAALSDGNVVVAWVDENGTPASPVGTVRAQVINSATGAKIGPEIIVSKSTPGNSDAPSVTALSDGRFVVSWEEANVSGTTIVNTSVRGQAFNADGSTSTLSFPVAVGGTALTHPEAVQLTNGAFVELSVHAQGTSSDIRAQSIAFPGLVQQPAPVGGADRLISLRAATPPAFAGQGGLHQARPVVAGLNTGSFAVAYQTQSGDSAGNVQISVRLVNADGSPATVPTLIGDTAGGTGGLPTITGLPGGSFVVGWAGAGDIRAQLFTAAGVASGAAFVVSNVTGGGVTAPAFTYIQGGGFAAVWQGGTTSKPTLAARLFKADGTPVAAQFAVGAVPGTTSQIAPAASGLHDGGVAITFWAGTSSAGGVYLQTITAAGAPGTPVKVADEAFITRQSVATLANDNIVVSWTESPSDPTGNTTGLSGTMKAQVFTPGGTAVSAVITVATGVDTAADAPGLTTLADGRFIVAYDAYANGTEDVRGRLYNADGTPSGAAFAIDTPVAGIRVSAPAITQLANGTIEVVTDHGNGGTVETTAQSTGNTATQDFTSDIWITPLTIGTPPALPQLFAGNETILVASGAFSPQVAALANGTFALLTNGPDLTARTQVFKADNSSAGAAAFPASNGTGAKGAALIPFTDGTFGVDFVDSGYADAFKQYSATGVDATGALRYVNYKSSGSTGLTANVGAKLSDGTGVVVYIDSTGGKAAGKIAINHVRSSGQNINPDSYAGPLTGAINPTSVAVAGLQNGGFALAFDNTPSGDASALGFGVYVQSFPAVAANTTPGAGSVPVLVSAGGAFQPRQPAVATLANGSFVVTWEEDGSSTTLKAQVFSESGAKFGIPITITSHIRAGDPGAVLGLADGRFLVAWTTDDATPNVVAQAYNVDGSVSGSSFAGNTPVPGVSVTSPTLTQLSNGQIEIVTQHQNVNVFSAVAETVGVSPVVAVTPPQFGTVADGYIKGATVFADANGNGVLDAGEATATTDAYGHFTFTTPAKGTIIAKGGTDTSTNLAFAGTLTAVAGSLSVTPLSTLVQKIAATNGGNVVAAVTKVTKAFGLAANTDLTAINAVADTRGGVTNAAKVYAANAQVANTLSLVTAAGATGDLYGNLATQLVPANSSAFNPGSLSVVTALGLSGTVAADTSKLALSSNALVGTKLASTPSGQALLDIVAGVQRAAQGDTSAALHNAVQTGTTASVVSAFTGTSLDQAATANVGIAKGTVVPNLSFTDTVTNTSGSAVGTAYVGPVSYLNREYIWSGTDGVAIGANVPSVFLHGGVSDDALVATSGSNVLDGGAGSNFLIGSTGADGGTDTFFVDGRGGLVTWSTFVNFHAGDAATIFGFHPGLSTKPFTAVDGTPGYTGLTIHSELNGPGTGVQASATFTGITQAVADAHFTITEGTIAPGTAGATDYLFIQWNK